MYHYILFIFIRWAFASKKEEKAHSLKQLGFETECKRGLSKSVEHWRTSVRDVSHKKEAFVDCANPWTRPSIVLSRLTKCVLHIIRPRFGLFVLSYSRTTSASRSIRQALSLARENSKLWQQGWKSLGLKYSIERTIPDVSRTITDRIHSFTLWLNTQLAKRPEIAPAADVVSGLCDGIKLIQLLVSVSLHN